VKELALKQKKQYTEAKKREAFFLYSQFESLAEVSKTMDIPVDTLKTWKINYAWDSKIQEQNKQIIREVIKKNNELEKTLEEIDEKRLYDKSLGDVSPLEKSLVKIPSSVVLSLFGDDVVTDDDVDNILTREFVKCEMAMLKIIENKVSSSLSRFDVVPKTFKDALQGLQFISSRYDKIFEKLTKIKQIDNKDKIVDNLSAPKSNNGMFFEINNDVELKNE